MARVIGAQDALRLADKPSDIAVVNPQRLLCHFDAELGDTTAQFEAFAAAQHACPDQVFDLELICLIPNPDNERICMAHDDPRYCGTFGAAYVIGLACAIASVGLSVWTPAALYGSRGVTAANATETM